MLGLPRGVRYDAAHMPRIRGVLPLLALAGCISATTDYRYPQDLNHPDYVKRSMAVREFSEVRDASQMPDAFDLLNDDEGHIRSMAHQAIREMSGGEDFGYQAYFDDWKRRAIVANWRAWWEAGKPDRAPVETDETEIQEPSGG